MEALFIKCSGLGLTFNNLPKKEISMSIDDLVKLDKKEFGLSFELTADAFCLLNDYGFTASTSSDDMERHNDRSIDLPSNGLYLSNTYK